MKKEILFLTILCFWAACADRGIAASMRNYYYDQNGLGTATGIVSAAGLNSIEIFDEQQKRHERFVYLKQDKEFHKGDYVRIYYHHQGAIIARIKRMTVLKYKNNGQNLGNIFHQE
jgi:hypothetical protein